jgi:hypothetical protein
MQAMSETLKDKWETADIQTVNLRHFKDTGKHRGRMRGQAWDTKGTTFKINHILSVNDIMFIFETKNDMIKGAEILRKHMLHFGLLMHHGKDGKKSKTDTVYFPPPGIEATAKDVA